MRQARPWVVLVATLTVQALVAMALLTLPVVAPVVAKHLEMSTAYLGAYVALVYFAAMFSSLLGGAAVKRWGAIRLSQAGLIFTGIGLFLCAVPHPAVIALGALCIGAGYGPITPASSHLLIKTTPPSQLSLVFSIKQTGVPLGGMIAGALIPSLDLLIGWQWAFVSAGLACVLCAVSVQPLQANLDDDRNPAARPSLVASIVMPLRLIFGHKSLRNLSMMSFLFAMCQMALTAYLVTFLFEDLNWTLVAAGVALTVAQAAGVGGRIIWGFISDRWLGPVRMLIVLVFLLIVGAIGTSLLTVDTSPWILYPLLILFGGSVIGWNGVYLAEVARQAPPGQAGIATGGTLCITFLGVMMGPPFFGLTASTFNSYGVSYAFLTIPAILMLLLLVPLLRKKTS